eukprot:TRINITY_DN11388_c2_g1_i1.p1 TRINITY_DN11388_c2_g1~~TRINITY_DN11388_c2_g1_i1.p1  ORF type:complete len:349 (+),score=72.57 TRINITY_DN11388_c2_g1_i1:49-1095(+)
MFKFTLVLLSRLYKSVASLSRTSKVALIVLAVLAIRRILALRDRKHTLALHYASMGAPMVGIHDKFIRNKAGLWIYNHCWPCANPRGIVFLVHGFSEHCGRYEHVARMFNEQGYSVYSFDHQGHGRSHGDRIHVERFKYYVDDAVQVLREVVLADVSGRGQAHLPLFLLGHSMGGLIAIMLMQRKVYNFSGTILSGPALRPDPTVANPVMRMLSRILGTLLPKLHLSIGPQPPVSHDPQVQAQYISDPLVSNGGFRTGWAHELLCAMDDAMDAAPSVSWPFVLIQGDADKLVDPRGATEFVELCASEDKTLLMYNGGAHELFNDRERERVFEDVLQWMQKHEEGADVL